ncbi:transferrin-binding protein-like solute binding protein [Planktomarina temperata]|nr:transferrin-binding protein-like solute binding protein [Planktomarina temperata]
MKKLPIIAASSTILLSACGGGDGIMSTRTFAADTPTPALALAEGKTLTAQAVQTAAMNTDYANATTSIKDSVVTISKNASGELSLTVNGKTYDFDAADRQLESDGTTSYGYAVEGVEDADGNPRYLVLSSNSGSIDDIINDESNELVYLAKYLDITDDIETGMSKGETGWFVVGSETQAAALGEFTTKSYSGKLRGEAHNKEDFSSVGNRTEFRSNDVTLSADFQANTISGTAGNILIRQRVRGEATPDFASVGGEFLFQNGTIDGADFTGTFSSDETFNANLGTERFDASFSGSFFGVEGEAVGGVIQGSVTDAEGVATIVGGFTAD